MSQVVVDNNQFELVDTPNKKRKRNENTPFNNRNINITSSTPIQQKDGNVKKVCAFENPSFNFNANKENNFLFTDSCMEVKSISELHQQSNENMYEVSRKPPKKKKKHDFEDSCFVNPALNLNAQDHSVNPFEVKRCPDELKSTKTEEKHNCFINPALNMKLLEAEKQTVNPFEVKRPDSIHQDTNPTSGIGIENEAFKETPTYTIAVPFTPSLNRRINFADVDLNELTPCKMLASQLVFTPENNSKSTPKRVTTFQRKSLSIISEEAVDIGEELDCYQLELENSINEAKVKKNGTRNNITNLSVKFSIVEEEEEETCETINPDKNQSTKNENATFTIANEETSGQRVETNASAAENVPKNKSTEGIEFEEIDDEDEDEELFKNPAPFQRTYRRSMRLQTGKQTSNEEDEDFKVPLTKSSGFKDAIRRSFRKIIHPQSSKSCEDIPAHGKEHQGILTTIRHSFRRKKINTDKEKDELNADELNITILDGAPRQVFRAPDDALLQGSGQFHKRRTFSRSSIRKTTKVLNTFFQKSTEDYNVD